MQMDQENGKIVDLPKGLRPYEQPLIQRVELAIDETLATGCKLGSDSGCVGPPVTAFEGGS